MPVSGQKKRVLKPLVFHTQMIRSTTQFKKNLLDGHKSFRLDGMICVSKVLEQQLLKSKNASKVKIKRIPYGVIIPDSKATRDDTSLRVIYVGRLAEQQKRISEVTRSFCEMTQKIKWS